MMWMCHTTLELCFQDSLTRIPPFSRICALPHKIVCWYLQDAGYLQESDKLHVYIFVCNFVYIGVWGDFQNAHIGSVFLNMRLTPFGNFHTHVCTCKYVCGSFASRSQHCQDNTWFLRFFRDRGFDYRCYSRKRHCQTVWEYFNRGQSFYQSKPNDIFGCQWHRPEAHSAKVMA